MRAKRRVGEREFRQTAMTIPLAARSARSAFRGRCCAHPAHLRRAQARTFLNLFKKSAPENDAKKPKAPEPVLSQDNLFHPFSKSPFQAVKDRAEAIKKLAPCPVCLKDDLHEHGHTHASGSGNGGEPEGATKMARKHVAFECLDCGWPTHCSEEHWKADEEHQRYCGRLKEANEDEHDLRSGRRMTEFEMPGMSILLSSSSNDHFVLTSF